jgi:hypothetical protein
MYEKEIRDGIKDDQHDRRGNKRFNKGQALAYSTLAFFVAHMITRVVSVVEVEVSDVEVEVSDVEVVEVEVEVSVVEVVEVEVEVDVVVDVVVSAPLPPPVLTLNGNESGDRATRAERVKLAVAGGCPGGGFHSRWMTTRLLPDNLLTPVAPSASSG